MLVPMLLFKCLYFSNFLLLVISACHKFKHLWTVNNAWETNKFYRTPHEEEWDGTVDYSHMASTPFDPNCQGHCTHGSATFFLIMSGPAYVIMVFFKPLFSCSLTFFLFITYDFQQPNSFIQLLSSPTADC